MIFIIQMKLRGCVCERERLLIKIDRNVREYIYILNISVPMKGINNFFLKT